MRVLPVTILIVSLLVYTCEKEKPALEEPNLINDTLAIDTTPYLDSTIFNIRITLLADTLIGSVEKFNDQELLESIQYTYSDSLAFKVHINGDRLIKSTYYLNEKKLAYESVDSIFKDDGLNHVITNYWTYDNDGYLMEKISYPGSIYFSLEDSSIITYDYLDGNQHVKYMGWSNGAVNTWLPYYRYSVNAPDLKHDIIEFKSGITGRLNKTLPYYFYISAGKAGTWDRRSFSYIRDLEGTVAKRIDTLYNELVHWESRPNEALSREIFMYEYQ